MARAASQRRRVGGRGTPGIAASVRAGWQWSPSGARGLGLVRRSGPPRPRVRCARRPASRKTEAGGVAGMAEEDAQRHPLSGHPLQGVPGRRTAIATPLVLRGAGHQRDDRPVHPHLWARTRRGSTTVQATGSPAGPTATRTHSGRRAGSWFTRESQSSGSSSESKAQAIRLRITGDSSGRAARTAILKAETPVANKDGHGRQEHPWFAVIQAQ